ncbi:unnamed protein product, partial [Symbiodinium sp. CCMP2456]
MSTTYTGMLDAMPPMDVGLRRTIVSSFWYRPTAIRPCQTTLRPCLYHKTHYVIVNVREQPAAVEVDDFVADKAMDWILGRCDISVLVNIATFLAVFAFFLDSFAALPLETQVSRERSRSRDDAEDEV